jgi:hypothetical protein
LAEAVEWVCRMDRGKSILSEDVRSRAGVEQHGSIVISHTEPPTAGAAASARETVKADPFVPDITRLLLTFLSVIVIDVVVVSLVTHRLRFWFPLWLDPQWANRPDPWVVYSQSYFAGIFMIPFLCRLIDRDFLARVGGGARPGQCRMASTALSNIGGQIPRRHGRAG